MPEMGVGKAAILIGMIMITIITIMMIVIIMIRMMIMIIMIFDQRFSWGFDQGFII